MSSKKALEGEGISSATIFNVKPEGLVIVGLDTDHKSRAEHPLWDERIHDPIPEEWVRNVAHHGVLQPIQVRKNGKRDDGSDIIEVVDGRQRVRWAREANKLLSERGALMLRVPCCYRAGTDSEAMGVMISANEIRHDDTPLIRARKLRDYLNTGRTDAEAAIQFGVNPATIRGWLKLLDLDETVQAAVERGDLSAHAAKPLTKLSREAQRAELARILETTPPPPAVEPEPEAAGEPVDLTPIPERKPRKATARAVQASTGGAVVPGKKEIRALFRAIDERDADGNRILDLAGTDPNVVALQVMEWILDGKTDRIEGFVEALADLNKNAW